MSYILSPYAKAGGDGGDGGNSYKGSESGN
jgi:hypothetical protein